MTEEEWTKPKALTKSTAPTNCLGRLSTTERRQLSENEAVIERGFKMFLEVGVALEKIKAGQLYRETHSTFEDYCRKKFEMSQQHAYRLVNAAHVLAALENETSPKPVNESQARPLSLLPPKDIPIVWHQIVEKAGKEKITARLIRTTVQEVLQKGNAANASRKRIHDWQESTLIHLQRIQAHVLRGNRDQVGKEIEALWSAFTNDPTEESPSAKPIE